MENDASSDPNEAFIPTKDDNGANRPAFNLLSNADLQREQLSAEVIEGERLHSNDYFLGTLPKMGMTNLLFSISNLIWKKKLQLNANNKLNKKNILNPALWLTGIETYYVGSVF